MSWFAKFYVYQENIKKHRNREYKNDDLVGLGMNEQNTGISYRYNSSGGIKSILIFTNAKITGTDNPVTTINSREYYDEDSTVPNYSSVNLVKINGDIYGLTTFYTTGESLVAGNIYEFPTETELVNYLNLDDSEKDLYAQEHANNYDAVQMGICDWKIYVGNVGILSQTTDRTTFTIRVDNTKITNDNLNDFKIKVYGGAKYNNPNGVADNWDFAIGLVGEYSITNNLTIPVSVISNVVNNLEELTVLQQIGDYYICVSLVKGNKETSIMGGSYTYNFSGIKDIGLFPVEGNISDGSTIQFFWDESPTTDIDYSKNGDTLAEGETP